jgi:hypothetical protein
VQEFPSGLLLAGRAQRAGPKCGEAERGSRNCARAAGCGEQSTESVSHAFPLDRRTLENPPTNLAVRVALSVLLDHVLTHAPQQESWGGSWSRRPQHTGARLRPRSNFVPRNALACSAREAARGRDERRLHPNAARVDEAIARAPVPAVREQDLGSNENREPRRSPGSAAEAWDPLGGSSTPASPDAQSGHSGRARVTGRRPKRLAPNPLADLLSYRPAPHSRPF